MKTTRNEAEVRTYSKPSGHRKVAGIPVSLLAVILVAGLAVAAIVALGPYSAPVTQTAQTIFAAPGSAAEPAFGQVEPNLVFGTQDHVLIQAWQSGYTTTTTIHLLIRLSDSSGNLCSYFAGVIADSTGALGKISLDVAPTTVFVAVSISAGSDGGSPSKCTIDAGVQFPTKSFGVTTAMISSAKGNAYNLQWEYLSAPANPIVYEFAAEV